MRKVDYSFKNLEPFNLSFIIGLPLLGFIFLWAHIKFEGFNPWLLIPAFVMYALTVFGISAGYHRLFAHRSYKANTFFKVILLILGATSGENTALKWAADHRRHHQHTDTDLDPHSIHEGFFFAHVGWVVMKEEEDKKSVLPKDLLNDKWVMWQAKYCLPIAFAVNGLAIALAGYFTGSWLGAIAIVGFLRLTFVLHITFFINSLCHMIGNRPYNTVETARDSMVLAFITFGEGYHNFHHAFQSDYRNGLRWYHWDPTKWIINMMSWVGQATDMRRTPESAILKAKMEVLSSTKVGATNAHLAELQDKVHEAQRKIQELKAEYRKLKKQIIESREEKLSELKRSIQEAKKDFNRSYNDWIVSLNLQAQMVRA